MTKTTEGPRWPTVYRDPDGGYVWTVCAECGPNVLVDDEGLCNCGLHALHYGVEAPPSARHEAEPVLWPWIAGMLVLGLLLWAIAIMATP